MSRNKGLLGALLAILLAGQAYAQTPQERSKELAYRAALGRADDVKLILSQGANPNGNNEQGVPVLLVAASRKDGEAVGAVQALLEAGAEVNVKDKDGQTALYYAARSGTPELVEYLLKNNIDYYSLDNKGDIARTIAFRAGRTEIVKVMDDFVKGQTLQAQTTYQNAEKMIAEQQNMDTAAMEAAEKKRQEEEAASAEEMRIERQKKLAEYQENMKHFDKKVHDISYNACAFQYWSFCLAANQTMEISDEEVEELINLHKQAVQEESMEVMQMFEVDGAYIDKIITPSKQAIYNQLASMPSRTWRKENGVGKLTDAHKRCSRISKAWEITVPKQQLEEIAASPLPAVEATVQPTVKETKERPYQRPIPLKKPTKPFAGGTITYDKDGNPIKNP